MVVIMKNILLTVVVVGGGHTQRAPTWTSLGTRWPLTWRATRDSRPPTEAPPMKTAGVRVASGRAVISWSSNSMTVGLTPMVARSFFMTWHMQQEERVKMITGCSDMSRWIRASVDSSTSMESEEEDDEVVEELVVAGVGVVRSRRTTSFEQRRRPCIVWKEKEVRVNELKWKVEVVEFLFIIIVNKIN